jgi:hypothetical protein
MKKTFFLNRCSKRGTASTKTGLNTLHAYKASLLALAFGLFAITGCKKDNNEQPVNVIDKYSGLSSQAVQELKAVQSATTRYKDIQNAVTDGYTDINVVVQNMGFHYMKAALADTVFNYRQPEILVYNKNHQGQVELVAVEYAVPIALRPNTAPEGFTGTTDVWKRDTGFGLWLLHAWVWAHNPEGVFNPTNPSVHLH